MSQSITVNNESDLNAAIAKIDAGLNFNGSTAATGTAYTITLGSGFTLSSDIEGLALVNSATLTIAGGNNTIDGGYTGAAGTGYRGFLVYQGDVTIENVTIKDTVARGGAGGSFFAANAGGGGAGLGGGLLVASGGAVTVSGVNFTGDAAIGGAGGNGGAKGDTGYGGGGGLGGNGGYGTNRGAGGGGGVGQGATGGDPSAQSKPVDGGTGILPGGSGGNGIYYGGSGAGTGGANSGGGGFGGGSNGKGTLGGGGGGGGLGGSAGSTANAGTGGTGGWGGGGGGGYQHGGAGGFGGGGGAGYNGGNGGFGGGGGGGGYSGYAGGGGGTGGFGAGNGGGGKSSSGPGGGGLGAGGAVFVQQGGTLIIGSGTESGGRGTGGAAGVNYPGTSGVAATAGAGFGSGIFIEGNQTVTFSPSSGTTLTINDVIADEAGSVTGTAGAGAISVLGGGTVTLGATNSFTGGMTIGGASTVNLAASGAAGPTTSKIEFTSHTGDTLRLQSAALPSNKFANEIAGFDSTDTLDLAGLSYVKGSTTAAISNGVLSATNGTTTDTLNLSGIANGTHFITSEDATGGTDIIICYCAGTRILTADGEVAVENLAVGDAVMTLSGAARRIVWRGEGCVLATPGRRDAATPVVVRRGALADNVPHQDLHVTKAHGLYVDDVLIPAEFLVNHRSIIWDDHAQEVRLYHIELETHDVLIANGAPAESYRDDGNRWLFRNANSGWHLQPKPPCAPVLTGGPIVDAVWRRLLERAGPQPSAPLTADPDLHLLVDGVRLDADVPARDFHIFNFARAPHEVRVISRAAAPQELGFARDPRRLGVALRRIVLRHEGQFRAFKLDGTRPVEGFHAFEADNGFRWTNGNALLPPEMFEDLPGTIAMILHIGARARYIEEVCASRAA